MITMHAPRRMAVALCLLLVACGGEGDARGNAEAPASTSDVGAALLSGREGSGGPSARNPDRGKGPMARGQTSTPPDTPAPTTPSEDRIDLDELGHTVGQADAPVQVVEFSDFACGYCRQFHVDVYPAIEDEYIETGKVEWKYVPMILGIFGPNADAAGLAGECAMEQGGFPAMRDRLFADQSEWKQASEPLSLFRRYAREEGLDVERWQRCMTSGERMGRVVSGTRLSRQVGVRGTPTFFIVGYASIPGALPLDLFRQVLDTAYAQATRPEGDERP